MKEQILSTLENSRQYTLEVAKAIPDPSYHFKPEGAGWNFAELLSHIGYGIYWWRDNFVLDKKTDWEQPPALSKKEDIITYLEEAFATIKQTLESIELAGNVVHGFYATNDHVTHHRGQAVVYLRCMGITPPEYKF